RGQGPLVEQVFTLAKDASTNIVFTGYQPLMLNLPIDRFLVDEGLNLNLADPFLEQTTYRVTIKVPSFNAWDLRKAPRASSLSGLEAYLQLPLEVPQRVKELALSLTQDKNNPYDKAKAIESFLHEKYPYTLSTEETPNGMDMVDFFLFDLKKGYCTYHATAMTVMMRSLDIPARWVTGFTTGTWNEDIQSFEVRNSDAHAWVEVYFEGFGWVPFEPTSSFTYPEEEKMDQPVKGDVQKDDEFNQLVNPQGELIGESLWELRGWLWLVAIPLVIGGLWLAQRLVITRRNKNSKVQYSPIQKIYLRMLKAMGAKGHYKKDNQTPREYAVGIVDQLPYSAESIHRLTEEYLFSRYGGYKHGQDELQWLEQELIELERKLNS
ncbi:MAG: DUF4129 domain-containing transglutaminase family protein, partial [Thermincolia bacterium]